MKKYLSIILVLLLSNSFSVSAQDEGPDALFHKVIKEYTLHKDGSYDLHYYKQLELISHYSMNRLYGETFIVYNPTYQQLKINDSYTIMNDGKKIVTPKNAFNEVLPKQAQRFPNYNHLREMVISHTGLELGATIYLDYTLSTSADMFDGVFAFFDELNQSSPIKDMEIIVHAPKDVEILSSITNMRLGADVSEKDGVKTYRWHFRHLQPSVASSIHNVCSKDEQMIFVSNKQAQTHFIDLKGYQFDIPSHFMEKVNEKLENIDNQYEKALSLKSFLNDYFETSPLSQEYIGNDIRSFEMILTTNVITHAEKNILFASILNKLNINTMPVVAYPKDGLANFSHQTQYLSVINIDNKIPFIIDANSHNDKNLFFNLGAHKFNSLVNNMYVKFPPLDKLKSKYETNINLEVTSKRVKGHATLYLNNMINPFSSLIMNKDNGKKLLKGHVDVNNVEIEKLEITNSTLKLEMEGEPENELNEIVKLDLPYAKNSVRDWHLQLPVKRDFSYEIPYPIDGTEKYEIATKGLKCINKDFSYQKQSDAGKVFVSLKITDDKVILVKQITLNRKCNPFKDYQDLRELIRTFDKEEINTLYFIKK